MANNNYDRMRLGETQEAPIANKAKQAKARKQSKAVKIAMIFVCIVAVVLFLGLVGALGQACSHALLGVFGWFGILLCLGAVAACILVWLGVRPKKKWTGRQKALLALGIVEAVLIALFLQIITSVQAYNVVAQDGRAGYEQYIESCYAHGSDTVGGVLLALIAYPFLAYVGTRLSSIVLSVLFFGILFAMIYPFWYVVKKSRVIEDIEPSVAQQTEDPMLFVESVDPPDPGVLAKGRAALMGTAFPNDIPSEDDERVDPDDEVDLNQPEYKQFMEREKDPEKRRQMAAELLYYLPDEQVRRLITTKDTPAYDATKDQNGPLQFGGDSVHAEFGRGLQPSTGNAAKSGSDQERSKRDSYDILFGSPAPQSPQSVVHSDTLETILPSGTRVEDLPKKAEKAESYFEWNKTPPVSSAPARKEAPPVNTEHTAEARRASLQEQLAALPRKEDKTSTEAARTATHGDIDAIPSANENDTMAEASQPAGRDDSTTAESIYFDSAPVSPAQASLLQPDVRPTLIDEDDGEDEPDTTPAAYDTQDTTPVEQEQSMVTHNNAFVERDEPTEEAANNYGGFVARQMPVEEEPEPEEKPAAPAPKPTKPKNEAPKSTAPLPDDSTVIQAHACAPLPPRRPKPYVAPPLSLLRDYPPPMDMENYDEVYQRIEQAFASFDIKVRVLGHTRGPTFTQYAVQLADGVSVKRVTSLEQDIVRKLRLGQDISIIPSVPGMDAIGVEMPNKTRSTVGLKPLLAAPDFRKTNKLYFVLGVDVRGNAYNCDILSGPHMLIAGSSGSGKSVCLNTLICSLLFNYTPDYVKFILIDPKGGVEMEVYNDVPHNLLGKAATNPSSTIKALDWAIEEMDRRYALLKDEGVRNIAGYNDAMIKSNRQRMPYILIIIDELADMMKSSKKMANDLEQRIARLTAKARACGIHVIVATQRPSVDVITGTIKNNIPSRVAFKTATQIDSKTILEKGCAEKLYGKGDMYYMGSDCNELRRLQAPFLDDDEVYDVTDYIRAHNEAWTDEALVGRIFKEDVPDTQIEEDFGVSSTSGGEGKTDSLFEQACRLVAKNGTVSISKLQREFRIGFTRAGYLVDEMEKRGFVDSFNDGSRIVRNVKITPADCNEIFGNTGEEDDE